MAQPLLRRAVEGREDTLTEEEARKILEQSMQVLFYRDARSIDQVRSIISCSFALIPRLVSFKLPRLPPRGCTSPRRANSRRRGPLRRAYGGTARRRSNRSVY